MLVLGRKPGEYIIINESIKVRVIRNETTGEIRLGIEAPSNVKIVRGESFNWEEKMLLNLQK